MGYLIECYAPSNYGKSTTIKAFCQELESMSNSHFEILFRDDNQTETNDLLRAYKRYDLTIFVISAGDYDFLINGGYNKLKYACGELSCDILICASTKNEERQSERIRNIENSIRKIAKENGHWIYSINIGKHYDKDNSNNHKNKLNELREVFQFATHQLSKKSID